MVNKLVPVDKIILASRKREIILYDGYYLNDSTDPASFENIVCYDFSGNIVWKVWGMSMYWDNKIDTYSGLSLTNSGELLGFGFSGNTYRIDVETGRAEWVCFSK